MDRAEGSRSRWAWLPVHMPGVARLMRDRKARHGDAWVAECWRRGVVERRPGWFLAAEGALVVGALDEGSARDLLLFQQAQGFAPGSALLVMPDPSAPPSLGEAADGTH